MQSPAALNRDDKRRSPASASRNISNSLSGGHSRLFHIRPLDLCVKPSGTSAEATVPAGRVGLRLTRRSARSAHGQLRKYGRHTCALDTVRHVSGHRHDVVLLARHREKEGTNRSGEFLSLGANHCGSLTHRVRF